MSKKKPWVRKVSCPVCKRDRSIRKDQSPGSDAVVCKSCSAKRAAFNSRFNRKRKGKVINCSVCKEEFYTFPSEIRTFCSNKCHDKSRRIYEKEERRCGFCSKKFVYIERPNSNSAGKYCSLACRNNSYAKSAVPYGHKGYRPRWFSARKKFIEAGNDFCASCGNRDGRLEVHHVIPYRICKNNDAMNLITLCHPCHAKYEKYSLQISRLPKDRMETGAAIILATLEETWHLHKGLSLNA